MKKINFLLLVCALFLGSNLSAAEEDITSLLATLSTAKAQVEGRAQRVRNCITSRDQKLLQDLRSKHDNARNHFNGWIDAWLISLEKLETQNFNAEVQAKDISKAISRINNFIESSDAALASRPCATKVFWKESVLAIIAITPTLIESAKSFFLRADTTGKERSALISALKQYKIAEWHDGTALVAFDFKTETFVPVSDTTALRASTSIYVNKWVLKEKAGTNIVAFKQPPSPLSKDYYLFTGKPSEINKIVLPSTQVYILPPETIKNK